MRNPTVLLAVAVVCLAAATLAGLCGDILARAKLDELTRRVQKLEANR